MELANQEEPVRTIKRQYIHLDDVLPPLETLVVAIEGSVDPAGVCCLSVPNRLMDDWAKKNEENTSFVALLNEYIVDEAVTFDPEATRLEDLLYRKSLSMASKLRAAKGRKRQDVLLSSTTIAIQKGEIISAAGLLSELNEARCMNEEADAFIEGLQDEVQDLRDALSEVRDSHNNQGGKFDAISNRHARRKIEEVSEHASKALEFLSTYGLVAESLNVHSTSGKMIHIHLTDDAASEKDDNMDLRVLYILDRYGIGDAFYHELAMLFSELPRSHSIKKARTDLNHTMQLTRIPGYEGAYRSFERSLCEQLSNMVNIIVIVLYNVNTFFYNAADRSRCYKFPY